MTETPTPAAEQETKPTTPFPSLEAIRDQCEVLADTAAKLIESGAVVVAAGELVADVTINDTSRTMILDARPSLIVEYLHRLPKLWRKRKCTQAERDAMAKATAAAWKGDGS